MSFTDLLADNGNNFNFAFDNFDFIDNSSNANGCLWEPYKSAAASSSGEDFLMYDDRGISSTVTTYSSSSELEGEGYSIYSDWNNTAIESNTNSDMFYTNDTSNYSNIILPTPQIATSSPPSSPASAQPPSVNNEIHNLSNRDLKRPHSHVAADLDTANILPLEHRRKRIKPARVRE
jgi:hypothetical protein